MFNIIGKIFNQVTGEVDEEKLAESKKLNRQPTESEKELYDDIMERFRIMKDHRETSCPEYLSNVNTIAVNQVVDQTTGEVISETASHASGFSWLKRWQRDWDLYGMKTSKNIRKADLNEVSSPLVYSTVQTIMGQFQDANTIGVYTAQEHDKETIARIAEHWQKNWEQKTNARDEIKNPWAKETFICGTGIGYNSHIRKVRTVSVMRTPKEVLIDVVKETIDPAEYAANEDKIKQDPEQFIDEAQAVLLKEEISKNPKKYLTQEKTIVDFDDFYIEHVPLEEFYVDPTALSLNGVSRDARDCIWALSMPIQDLIALYESSEDPFIIQSNIDESLLPKASGNNLDEKINDVDKSSYEVTVIRYYNKRDDKYVVIANNKIIRNGPLPYNHKLLPFSVAKCVPVKNSFYGIGVSALLDNLQSREELYSQLQDYITYHNSNLGHTYTDQTGEVEAQLEDITNDDGSLIVGTLIKMGQGDTFSQIPPLIDNGDIARRRDEIDNTATKISGINPLVLQSMASNNAVRNNQMVQESSLVSIRMYINAWAMAYRDSMLQGLSIVKQMSLNSYTRAEDNIEEQQPGYIEMEGYELKNGQLEPSDQNGKVTLTEDIVDSFDKLKVNITIETQALASKAMQAQELQDTMGMVSNIFSNPVLSDNQLVQELLKQYLTKKGMDAKVLSYLRADDSEEQVIFAEMQNKHMIEGQKEPPISGMSQTHMMEHVKALNELFMQWLEMDNAAQAGEPVDPMGMQSLKDVINSIQQHLAGDRTLALQSTESSLTMAGTANQAPQAPMPTDGLAQMQQPDQMQQQEPIPPIPPQGNI